MAMNILNHYIAIFRLYYKEKNIFKVKYRLLIKTLEKHFKALLIMNIFEIVERVLYLPDYLFFTIFFYLILVFLFLQILNY